jgi:phosphate transport system substrate-binding protein
MPSTEFIKSIHILLKLKKIIPDLITMRKIELVILFSFFLIIFAGCRGYKPGDEDTTTYGEISITVDETFAPVIESEVDTFEKIYKYAKIHVRYKPEAEVMNDLLADSSRFVIIPRKLNAEEKEYFKKIELVPKETKIFYDAIAVIVNNANKDTSLTFQTFKDIISGKIKSWKEVNKKSGLSDIQVIYDNPNSSTVRFVKERIGSQLSKNSYAVKNNPAVINYVSKNKNAIGLIGVNWVSDRDDTLSLSFLKSIKVVGLTSDLPNVDPYEYYQPYQAYIAQKFYPLYREVYIISREARAGLGTGLSAFIAAEKGQRIFLKSGLVPATMPIRLVEINRNKL